MFRDLVVAVFVGGQFLDIAYSQLAYWFENRPHSTIHFVVCIHDETSCFMRKENYADILGEGLEADLVLLYSA